MDGLGIAADLRPHLASLTSDYTVSRYPADFVRDHLPRLRAALGSLEAVAFGSRVRSFSARSRPSRCWTSSGGLELLCYTPDEFAEKREEFGIVRTVVEEGLRL